MNRLILILIISVTLLSCAPVIRKEVFNAASRDVSFTDIRDNPDLFKGRLFILGGIIVETKVTDTASIIEAIYVPVDKYGNLKDIELVSNRFMATYPRRRGFLDPLIYRKGREITVAGAFIRTDTGKIGEMEYVYPLFEIKELYLWEEEQYYLPPPYPYWYDPYYYWWDDPWWHRHYYPSYPYRYGPHPGR